MNYHHHQDMTAAEELNDLELQSVTGGCKACVPDLHIIEDTTDIAQLSKTLDQAGIPHPPGIKTLVRDQIKKGNAAVSRIVQRHPTLPARNR